MPKIATGLIRQTSCTAAGFPSSLFKIERVSSNPGLLYINSPSNRKSGPQSKKINTLLVNLPVCACNEQLSKTTRKRENQCVRSRSRSHAPSSLLKLTKTCRRKPELLLGASVAEAQRRPGCRLVDVLYPAEKRQGGRGTRRHPRHRFTPAACVMWEIDN